MADVISIACPLLVPLIEEHFFDHPATQMIVKDYLAPLKQKNIDTLLLGCTHYPLLHKLIQNEMGQHVSIIDSATTCAAQVAEILDLHGIRNQGELLPTHFYYASDNPEKFRLHGINFLGQKIEKVEKPSKMKFEL